MTERPHLESAAAAMTRTSRERGYLLSDMLRDCLQRAPVQFSHPIPDPERLRGMDQSLPQRDFLIHPFEVSLPLSEAENPFLALRGEPQLSLTLRITAAEVTVSLVGAEHRPLGTSRHQIGPGWTLDRVPDAVAQHLDAQRNRKAVEQYLARWQLLSTSRDRLQEASQAIAVALEAELAEAPPTRQPWAGVVSAVIDAPRLDRAANALAALGRSPPGLESLATLARLVARVPQHLHLALELALLAVVRDSTAAALPFPSNELGRAQRLLRDFAAPGEPMPALLADHVSELLDAIDDVLAGRALDAAPYRSSVSWGQAPFWLEEQLATMAVRFGWGVAGREAVLGALLESDLDHPGATLRILRDLAENRGAHPGEIERVILVRQWCAGEGYGKLIYRPRSTHAARQPPTYAILLEFVRRFEGAPDIDEITADLHELVRQGRVDPDDFETSLRRHLKLVEYAEEEDL